MFAEQLKQARAAAGLTQQGLSDLLEVPKRTIQDWEGENRTPPPYVQKLILNELSRHKAPTEVPHGTVYKVDLFGDRKKPE